MNVVRQVRHHPYVLDGFVVLAVLTLARLSDHGEPNSAASTWALYVDLVLTVPLFWRRRYPLPVFLFIAATALIQWFAAVSAGGDIAILVALYAVGGYESRRRMIGLAAVISELGVFLAAFRWTPAPHRAASIILLTGTMTAACVLGVYRRTRRDYLASVLERAATAERERDQQAVIAGASERARISREMHDIVAHSLSVMIALSDGAAIAVTREPDAARQAMEQSSALGRQALGEVRRLLGNEDSGPLAPQPGIGQLEDLVAQVRSAGLAVDLVFEGRPLELAPGAQLAIYRTVQEALTNVIKHARAATRAIVTVRYGSAGVDIEVRNDDEPTPHRPAPAQLPTSGHGLAGMRQRAAVFGGSVVAARQPDGGWRVAAHLTFQEEPGR